MTHQALTFAMARIGDMPTCDCPCCGDTKDRDDMMGDTISVEFAEALEARFGRPVCKTCADEYDEICIDCGAVVKDSERQYTQLGYVCTRCVAEAEAGHTLNNSSHPADVETRESIATAMAEPCCRNCRFINWSAHIFDVDFERKYECDNPSGPCRGGYVETDSVCSQWAALDLEHERQERHDWREAQ